MAWLDPQDGTEDDYYDDYHGCEPIDAVCGSCGEAYLDYWCDYYDDYHGHDCDPADVLAHNSSE